ncbi:MAG: phosphatidate cytidylyltransferase [Anaerovibrio sp.]|uniref:phosphatidate cytidylyltransferase n=1 Tax=Anaerovibrio sp. TaxID=1872532 RepID=UPI0025E7D0D1|nr:phosphatidate cytidylyltransferase [Anaerovibrio sp.]MCR5175283.1 phosphatidate cytidylyltransferase [Anaerovibrio sp.]
MLTRTIAGVVGIILAAFVIQTGGTLFAIAGLLLALGAWYEYCRAFRQKNINAALVTGALLLVVMWTSGWLGGSTMLVGATMLSALVIMLLTVIRHERFTVIDAAVSMTGVFYIGLAFVHLVMLRFVGAGQVINTSLGEFQTGCAFIWVALIGTWASDTFAYFAGCFFGRHKLCVSISPKKTIEGFVGGLVGTTCSVAGLGLFFGFDTVLMALLGLIICIIATLGDLVESVVKRYTGIKDSGNIIPGHGGIWDRFDSVIYTAPFVYYFMYFTKLAG